MHNVDLAAQKVEPLMIFYGKKTPHEWIRDGLGLKSDLLRIIECEKSHKLKRLQMLQKPWKADRQLCKQVTHSHKGTETQVHAAGQPEENRSVRLSC